LVVKDLKPIMEQVAGRELSLLRVQKTMKRCGLRWSVPRPNQHWVNARRNKIGRFRFCAELLDKLQGNRRLCFIDEAGYKSSSGIHKQWSSKFHRPSRTVRSKNITLIAACGDWGGYYFAIVRGGVNADVYQIFLKQLFDLMDKTFGP